MTTGPKIRYRVECPIHGSMFETEAKPQAAWCGKCKKTLQVITLGTNSGRSVGTNAQRRRT